MNIKTLLADVSNRWSRNGQSIEQGAAVCIALEGSVAVLLNQIEFSVGAVYRHGDLFPDCSSFFNRIYSQGGSLLQRQHLSSTLSRG